jgi:hypothetical protein
VPKGISVISAQLEFKVRAELLVLMDLLALPVRLAEQDQLVQLEFREQQAQDLLVLQDQLVGTGLLEPQD